MKSYHEGETTIIERNNPEVVRLIPTQQTNWRDHMSSTPQLLVSPEELIEPMADIWEAFT